MIGSEAVRYFHERGETVAGIDNDARGGFFGKEGSTAWMTSRLKESCPGFLHHDKDIRDREAMDRIFAEYGSDLRLVIHTAAQPSHDWAAGDPHTDFSINATGTLNLLESARRHAPEAVFIYTSTNKVYGDTPNGLPFEEHETRWELPRDHPFYNGIPEEMSLDHTTHSLFGVSKAAGDLLVQEYGRYFGMKTVCFRGGCLTGGHHAAAKLHGFLAYLVRCAVEGRPYQMIGYKGKQVRDNIHSRDLIRAFDAFARDPRVGAVYNIGGGRTNSCSILEAVQKVEELTGRKMNLQYKEDPRVGDHQWYISDLTAFRGDYPDWSITANLEAIFDDLVKGCTGRN